MTVLRGGPNPQCGNATKHHRPVAANPDAANAQPHQHSKCRRVNLWPCQRLSIPSRPQLYDATSGSDTKLGSPVVLNVTSGAGTDADPYVATLGPFSRPLIIKVSIQATGGAGSVSTDMSDKSEAAVVGECWQQCF